MRGAAEYRSLALQTYRVAAGVLPQALADPDWSAVTLPQGAAQRPPAIILDIDETVLDNSQYQVELGPRPFDRDLWDRWIGRREAPAVPGAVAFLEAAAQAGAEAYFITNRSCRPRNGESDPCPQERDTLENLARVGIVTDATHLMLRGEQPDWTSEKRSRREQVAARHRVLMLFGDDLADFLPCVRTEAVPPCTAASTAAERAALVEQHQARWGRQWFVLPNPMYGSWQD